MTGALHNGGGRGGPSQYTSCASNCSSQFCTQCCIKPLLVGSETQSLFLSIYGAVKSGRMAPIPIVPSAVSRYLHFPVIQMRPWRGNCYIGAGDETSTPVLALFQEVSNILLQKAAERRTQDYQFKSAIYKWVIMSTKLKRIKCYHNIGRYI